MSATLVPGIVAEFGHRGRAVRFFVRNLADSIQNVHANGAFYEEPELAIIERHLKADSVYLDVGSNVGNHVVFVAKFCQPKEVIAIEPNPEAMMILQFNILLNRLTVDTHHLGLGLSDAETSAVAAIPRNNLGGARMVEKEGGSLKLVTGDSLFAGRHIDFIKLDVEGLELKALAGLEKTIAASRPAMFIEVDDQNRQAFDAWVSAHDYEVVENFRRYRVNENFMLLPRERAG